MQLLLIYCKKKIYCQIQFNRLSWYILASVSAWSGAHLCLVAVSCDWVFAGARQAAERDNERRGHEGRLQNVRSECLPTVHTPHSLTLHWFILPQLELTKTQIKKISNEDGFIAKADFIKCAQVLPLAAQFHWDHRHCAGHEAARLHRPQGGPQPPHGQHEVQEGAGPQHQGEAPDCWHAGTLARPLRRSTAPTRRTCRWCSTRRRARPRRGNQSSHQNPSLSQRRRRYCATFGFIIT